MKEKLKEVPEKVQLDVLTVRRNFAQLTFHGKKRTHVAMGSIFCGREGECVAMRVSKGKGKTSFDEYVWRRGGALRRRTCATRTRAAVAVRGGISWALCGSV